LLLLGENGFPLCRSQGLAQPFVLTLQKDKS